MEWAIVEPVNGQIKEVVTHNLLKLFRFRRTQQQALVAAGLAGAA